jgi:[acyl-carrier-protein] S-malonyltransferase
MIKQGCSAVVECGPGKVLLGLNKRIAADATHLSLSDAPAFQVALNSIRQGQG